MNSSGDTPMLKSNTHGEQLWFNSAKIDTTSEQESNDLTASNRRPSTPHSRNFPQSSSQWTWPDDRFARLAKSAKTSLPCSSDVSKMCWRVKNWSVVLIPGRKPNWVSSSFSELSRGIFFRVLEIHFFREAKGRDVMIVLISLSIHISSGLLHNTQGEGFPIWGTCTPSGRPIFAYFREYI